MKSFQRYLPSTQFILIVGSLLLATGLVYAAQRITEPQTAGNIGVANTPTDTSSWQDTLAAIQAQNASSSLPQPVSQSDINQILKEAQTANLTDTVGRTLLIELTNAQSQGLGNDTPTQQAILADATAQIPKSALVTYTQQDLTIVSSSNANLHAYGNEVMTIMQQYTGANSFAVLEAVGNAADNNDPKALQALPPLAKQYKTLAQALLKVPVPQTVVPLHLIIVNDFEGAAENIVGMETLLSDPLRGMISLNQFSSLISEENRVFTNIAQQFQGDGILFKSTEPGNVWNVFLPHTP